MMLLKEIYTRLKTGQQIPLVCFTNSTFEHPEIYIYVIQEGIKNKETDDSKFLCQVSSMIIMIEKFRYIENIIDRFKNLCYQTSETKRAFVLEMLNHYANICQKQFEQTSQDNYNLYLAMKVKNILYQDVLKSVNNDKEEKTR